MAMGKSYKIWHKINGQGPYSVLLEQRNRDEALLFESLVIAALGPAEVDVVKKLYTKLSDAYGCLGVLLVNTGDGPLQYLVLVTGCVSVGKIGESEVFRINQTTFVPLKGPQTVEEERVTELRKLFNSGTFYFLWSSGEDPIDATLCTQKLQQNRGTDNRFFWNRLLHLPLQHYGIDCSHWLLRVTCGSVEIRTVYAGHRQFKAAIFSRLSCERAGTRFNVRGVNDEGHVANFVETEQLIYGDQGDASSFLQTRGSVPLFWEQPGVQVGSHKVRFSRGPEASSPALERHLKLMQERYHDTAIVNLLGLNMVGAKEGEASLSQLFQADQKRYYESMPHIMFDYHQECKGGNLQNLAKLKQSLQPIFERHSLFLLKNQQVVSQQKGVIRTNCLDCLDRTNCVQTFIGLEILALQLEALEPQTKPQTWTRFEEVFRAMWVNNGNEISKIYAGTGAIQGGSKIMDGARSAARTIQNNLLDSSKQEAFDLLIHGGTGNEFIFDLARSLLPPHWSVLPADILHGLCSRYAEFTQPLPIRIAVGTYNVNGGHHFRSVVYKDSTLADWLLDSPHQDSAAARSLVCLSEEEGWRSADIYAVGFEEIVDLNASNIMAASSENAKAWATELQKVLSRDRPFTLLTYVQLVGVCLYVFIRPELAADVRDVATDSVKTGLGGATGNKGGVAIRFLLRNTSLCFVCSHFAAGQSQWAERNADYAEITRRISFPHGRKVEQHDFVFWCGDFNYRIDLDRDEVKEYVSLREWSSLLQYDQLKIQQAQGNTFVNYVEGEISFPPTYKYDLFSDDYDTSEKCRAPAWTDRVLFRKRRDHGQNPGRIAYYGRAELKQSDHRPVMAFIDIEILATRIEKTRSVLEDVVGRLGPSDATVIVQLLGKLEHDDDQTSWADDEMILTSMLSRVNQAAGDVLLIRFAHDGLLLTFRSGTAALAAVALSPIQVNHLRLGIKLKTTDWPAAVARDFLLAAANTVPLFIPEGSVIPLESRTVDEDIRVLAQLANQIQTNDGLFKPAPNIQTGSSRSPMMPRPPPPNSLALQQQQQTKEWNTANSAPPPVEPPPPAPPIQAPPQVSRPLPPVPARNASQTSLPPPGPPVVQMRQALPPNGIVTAPQIQPAVNIMRAPPPIPARNLPPVPPRTIK